VAVVAELGGRKAVEFYYGPWNLPLEFPTMIADFYAPKSLAANGAFTAAAWRSGSHFRSACSSTTNVFPSPSRHPSRQTV